MIRRRKGDELVPRDYWVPFNWNPFGMLEEMDRMFDDLRLSFENYIAMPGVFGTATFRTPAVDLVDEGDEYKLHAEMPGIKKEDVNLEIGENELEISAETKEEKKEEDEKKGYIRRERRYSKFYRRIPLPQQVDSEKAEAELKDGVLTVRLPKISHPEKKTKKVSIK